MTKAISMKGIWAIMLSLAIALGLCLTGCGSSEGDGDYSKNFIGSWKVIDMVEDGSSSAEDMAMLEAMGVQMIMEFKEDGSFKREAMGETMMEGTWKAKDATTLSMESDGATGDAVLKDGKLVAEADDVSLTLERLADDASSSSSSS